MIRNIDHANVIHYGSDSLIIRSNDNGQKTCIKIINEEFPSPELITQLENEFEICSKTNSRSIRKALRKEKQDEHAALILEYVAGKDLAQFIADENAGFEKQLRIAVSIANALYDLQKENIFHGQLHPANIIIENNTNDAWLIDFGFASVGNTFRTAHQFMNDKQTDFLKYIAPEQTGRINRPIDNRADLYSFGVILYQLFTGLVPFESDERLELIYAHVAKTPEEARRINKDLPQAVSDIIMTLLSKNAEDRYQSAFGVKADLEKCLTQFELHQRIDEFRLASQDFSGRLFIQTKLYGREKELDHLNNLLDSCVSGKKTTLLLSGYSGSGKSALIESLHKPVSQKKGYFIKGKFDQISSNTPYSTFVQAFNELIQMILTGDDAYRVRWRKRIMDTMGGSVKILAEFIPGIEELTGKLPDIPLLKGIEAQNRFNYEFARFIKTIAVKEHPIVIFIDDLQWADASSLSLIKIIAENRDIEYLMLIGAYRNNEVDENHPLIKKISELRDENVAFDEMELNDLSFEDVNSLVEGALTTKLRHTSFLAEMIYDKTKGNAFYTWQFLKSIYDERFLWFDFEKHHWQWNADLIMQMNVSGNVVDLMTNYVQKLPPETLSLLETASTIGNRFDKKTLALVKQTGEKLQGQLNIAVSDGLLIPAGDEYKFAHDRVQQAIYSLIPERERTAIHLLNGRRLAEHYRANEQQERIFEIVNQWNLGAASVTDKKDKAYLADLNLLAGKKAMASTAYPQALQYFEKGIAALDNSEWEDQYNFLLDLTTNAAEAAYLSGEYDSVDRHVQSIIQHGRSMVDSVKGYEIEIKKLIAQNKLIEAINFGIQILNKLGIKLPVNPGRFSVLKDLLQIRWLLRNKTANYFGRLPEMEDEQKKAAMRIMSEISSASYFAVPNLVPVLVFKMVEMTVKYGLSVKSPFSFAAYGYILSAHLKQINRGSKMGEIAIQLAKRLDAAEVMGSIITTTNLFLDHWKKPLTELSNDLEKAFKTSLEYGDNEYASYAAHNLVYHLFFSGTSLQTLSKKAEMLDLQVEKFKQNLTLKRIRLFRQAIDNLIHETEVPDLVKGNVYDESVLDIGEVTKENEVYFQNLYILKSYLALLFNNSEHAKKYIVQAGLFQETVKGTSLSPLFYFFRSLAIADSSINTAVKKPILRQVKKDIKQLRKYEKLAAQYNCHKTLLLQAEYYYLKGEMGNAKIFYDKALTTATENGMINDLAFCWERAGQFFLNTKQDLLADFYLQNAYRTYKRWGADSKLKQMEKRYTHLHSGKPIRWHSEAGSSDTVQVRKGNLDMETVLKASSAISGEIVLSRLLRKMMQIISESAGAQTGYLIMERKGERCIEAEIKKESDSIKVLQSLRVHQSGLLAESVLNYVYLTKETVILDDALKSQLFSHDEFIQRHECKSILCFPLINLGRVHAVIYLSNDLTYGAFTENRVALLEVLASQMAISIENALFYTELENKVEERTNELYIEKKKSDDLLLNILPEVVAQELKQTGRTTPRSYEVATVMFTDFENFTRKSEKLSPEELVSIIDSCFKKFDEIISRYNIEKIKTIGDAYLCVSGLPDTKDHNAANVISAAMEIIDVIKGLQQEEGGKGFFDIRIGIHTGPLVAGVVGNKKFAYDIWGDTVNTAARMEQSSEANRINISQSTYELVKDKFQCKFRGKQPAKNKGLIEMYFVENLKQNQNN